jgi:hypothetical protein
MQRIDSKAHADDAVDKTPERRKKISPGARVAHSIAAGFGEE